MMNCACNPYRVSIILCKGPSLMLFASLLQFFTTKPYACEPSSLPKYPPSKEMDAKLRDEEARRWLKLLMTSHDLNDNLIRI